MEEKLISRIIRIVTLNLWHNQGPIEKRMPLIIEGFKELSPGIMGLQEVLDKYVVGGNSFPNQAEYFAKELGYNFVFEGSTHHSQGLEGIAVLSKYPILESDYLELPYATKEERRVLLHALIETPITKIHFYSTHLNWKLDEGYIREKQVLEIQRYIKKKKDDIPVILTGDFNARPDSSEIRFLKGLQSMEGESAFYQDTWEKVHPHEDGDTWNKENVFTRTWLDPGRRIDYIFVSRPTRDEKGFVVDSRLVFNRHNPEGIFPSDHFGLMAEIRY